MSKLINIKDNKGSPLIMDVSNISVVVENIENKQATVSMHDLNQGRFFSAELENWGLETDNIITRIEETGTEMFSLPFHWGESREIGRYFVNPSQVESIIVSGERQKDGEDEPHVGLLVDVKGYGRVETYKAPVSVVEAFVQAVENVNSNMVRFDADEVSSRWGGQGGYTMVDSSEIRNVFPNGWDIDIQFNDGMRLDFHLDPQNKTSKAGQDYLKRLFKKLQGDGDIRELAVRLDGGLDSLLPRISKFEDKYRKNLREKFAAAITANTPDIVKIEGAKDVYYTRTEDISFINVGDESLSIHFKKASSQQYSDDMTIFFDSKQAAQAGMNSLLGKTNSAKNKY